MIDKPILVIGDACVDQFVYGHCDRLSPEAPVPVLDIVRRSHNAGMAGNVYCNIIDLDVEAELLCNSNSEHITKTRYVDDKTNHMFLRIDDKVEIPRISDEEMNGIEWAKYSAIVISDYNKGFLTEADIMYIAKRHPLTFMDTKKLLGDWARAVSFIKINHKEYLQSAEFIDTELDTHIIETLGDRGCRHRQVHYHGNPVEVSNLAGAGDTFLAGFVVEYLRTGGDISSALIYANKISSLVVQKRGVSTIKG